MHKAESKKENSNSKIITLNFLNVLVEKYKLQIIVTYSGAYIIRLLLLLSGRKDILCDIYL